MSITGTVRTHDGQTITGSIGIADGARALAVITRDVPEVTESAFVPLTNVAEVITR